MPADPGEGVAAGTAAVLAEADLYPRDVTDPPGKIGVSSFAGRYTGTRRLDWRQT
jgi:hypothetical protein